MSLRALLRSTTSDSHDAIEKNPALSLLTSPHLTEGTYVAILERYYGFFRPMENALRAAGAPLAVSKSSELVEDLLAFGLSPQSIETLPFCRSLPSVASPASRIGVQYVMEGSALGGLMIARHLATFPWYTPARGSFFHADSAGVAARWKDFVASLDAIPPSLHEEAAQSALATFSALDNWMSGAAPRG